MAEPPEPGPEDREPPAAEPQQTLDLEPQRAPLPSWVRGAGIALALLVAVVAALSYRGYHRRKVLREGLARAAALVRPDTAAGYREAARLLEPLALLDPIEAGSLRALALAMLFCDYRDTRAAGDAESLLVEPGRAAQVPESAQLAYAALALGRLEAGTAAGFASRAPGPLGDCLQARVSITAGNLGLAAEPLARAVEADPSLPMSLALRGDVQRRSGLTADARHSYELALGASPNHARAAFGLGKLALSGGADAAAARTALARLVDDRDGTPRNERVRAALHLAALQARAGDRAGAGATIDKVGLEPPFRAWLERAVAEEELQRGPYRVVGGAPPSLATASDDDPYVAPPPPLAAPIRIAPPAKKQKVAKKKPKKAAKPVRGAKKPAAKKDAKAKKSAAPAKPQPAARPKPKPPPE